MPERQRAALLRRIAAAVTDALTKSFVELLASSAKTQASLSKLRKASAAAAGASDGGLSSVAKIQQQLQRDAAEFGRLLDKLLPGLPGELAEFAALQQTVQGDEGHGARTAGSGPHAAANGGAAPEAAAEAPNGDEAGSDLPNNGAADAAEPASEEVPRSSVGNDLIGGQGGSGANGTPLRPPMQRQSA